MSRNLLKSSFENASFSIAFQLLFRCVTFAINSWVLRNVERDLIGVMNVRLLLLESTILFLSREPFQRACLSRSSSLRWGSVVNQIWLAVPAGVFMSTVSLYVWLRVLGLDRPEHRRDYEIGCWSVALSCVVELLSANLSLVAQIFCFVKLRVALDTLHVVVRTAIFLSIVVGDPGRALLAFSAAQLLSSVILTLAYYAYFHFYIQKLNRIRLSKTKVEEYPPSFRHMEDFPFKSISELLPKLNPAGSLDPELGTLTLSFAKQGLVKQILTEGEKYIMSVSPVLSLGEQGVYDVVNNLGSLAARFVFRPIEESGYFYFTQTVERNREITQQDAKRMEESCAALNQLCRVVLSIGLVILVFGQSYARTLLLLYGGEGFVEAGLSVLLMRCHCLAVVLLAVNGVTECYCFATMTSGQLDRYNRLMVFFSIGFLALSYALTALLGPVGFILSNCANMSARILHSLHFIRNRYRGSGFLPLEGLLVGRKFAVSLLAAGVVCKASEARISSSSQIWHVFLGAVVLASVLAVWAYENWQLLRLAYLKYIKKHAAKEKNKDE